MRKLTERFAVAFPNRSEDAVRLQQWYYRNWDEPEDGEANRQKFNEVSCFLFLVYLVMIT